MSCFGMYVAFSSQFLCYLAFFFPTGTISFGYGIGVNGVSVNAPLDIYSNTVDLITAKWKSVWFIFLGSLKVVLAFCGGSYDP